MSGASAAQIGAIHALASRIGLTEAERRTFIARQASGKICCRRLSLPKRAGDEQRLVAVLWWEGPDLLCAAYGGETIIVPMGPAGTLAAARMQMASAGGWGIH